jgi:hypothetical protein
MSPYGDSDRAGERWDTERFSRESHQRRGPPVLERETRYEEVDRYARAPSVPGSNRGHDNPAGEFYVRRPVRYREEERVEFSDRRRPGRFFEDDPEDAYEREHRDRREERGQLVPFERTRETVVERRSGRTAAPRPGLVRRQSSLDTYDRKPLPRYRETEIVQKRRRSPPERFVERVQEEEVLVGDSEYYAEEEVRAYLERDTGGGRREVVEEREEREEVVESEFPKRGKTRMPMRLVNRRAVIELGYPFVEEVRAYPSAKRPVALLTSAGRDPRHPQGARQRTHRRGDSQEPRDEQSRQIGARRYVPPPHRAALALSR